MQRLGKWQKTVPVIAVALLTLTMLIDRSELQTGDVGLSDGMDGTQVADSRPAGGVGQVLLGTDFTENRGQLGDASVGFYARGEGFDVAFGPGWVSYNVRSTGRGDSITYRVWFEGSQPVKPEGIGPFDGVSNYFYGSDPEGWIGGARSFKEVRYSGLWEGIDIVFRLEAGVLKYDLIVHPGADPDKIQFRYDGVEGLAIDEVSADLLVSTKVGMVRDRAPSAYQLADGVRTPVAVSFGIVDPMTVLTQVGGYDCTTALVIDPEMTFSTFLGGSDLDCTKDLTTDSMGHPIITGVTVSWDFPTTVGTYKSNSSITSWDVFVAMMSTDGKDLLRSGFVGGSSNDEPRSIAIDDTGCVYVTGSTESEDFPTTGGAFCRTRPFSDPFEYDDVFVFKLEADWTALNYSTYIHGYERDWAWGIDVDASGCAYITGDTHSKDYPLTSGSFADKWITGVTVYSDVFVTKLSSDGSSISYSTLIGAGTGRNGGRDIKVLADGNVIVTGSTRDDFPTTEGAFCTTVSPYNNDDIFVLKLNGDATALEFSTTIGGGYSEWPARLCLDETGSIFVTGYTQSEDYPTTEDSYCQTIPYSTDTPHVFISRLDSNATTLLASTYVGGSDADFPHDICLDGQGGLIITGDTLSYDYPLTEGNSSAALRTGAFITQLDGDLTAVEYSRMIGGVTYDRGTAIVMDGSGAAYVTCDTHFSDFPVTAGAYDMTWNGGSDGVLIRLEDFIVPQFGEDGTPREAFTGDLFNFSIGIMDNSRVTSANVTYWYGNDSAGYNMSLALKEGTVRNGTWTCQITVPGNAMLALNYCFTAEDDNGYRIKSRTKTVPMIDNDRVAFGDSSDPVATTGDVFHFRVRADDNVGISEVRVLYWFGDWMAEAANVMMVPTSVDGRGNGAYVWANLTIPAHSLEPLSYMFLANETSGNRSVSGAGVVEVRDNDAPEFVHGPPVVVGLVNGVEASITVELEDNIGVLGAWFIYSFGQGAPEAENVSMRGIDTDGLGNGTYGLSLDVPLDGEGPLGYRFSVVDFDGNWNLTGWAVAVVADQEPPFLVEDATPSTVGAGQTLVFAAVVGDNLELKGVWVAYWFGNRSAEVLRAPMTRAPDAGDPRLARFNASIVVPADSLDPISYRFELLDAAGNPNRTAIGVVTVIDPPPELVDDLSDAIATTCHYFNIRLYVKDNIGITEVKGSHHIEGWSEGAFELEPIGVDEHGNGCYFFKNKMPYYRTGHYYYTVRFFDVSGNVLEISATVPLIDNVPPALIADNTVQRVLSRTTLTVSAQFHDYIGIKTALVVLKTDAEYQYSLTEKDGNWTRAFDVGELTARMGSKSPYFISYHFLVMDTSGNNLSTLWRGVEVVNVAPSIEGLDVWVIEEGISGVLDLSKYIVDPNDALANIMVHCHAKDVQLIGFNLSAFRDRECEDERIHLYLYDGDDPSFHDFTLRVRGVNDPPVITVMLPIDGRHFGPDRIVYFHASATDEEGDDLNYTWMDGTQVIGRRADFEMEGLAPGRHAITLIVSDGKNETTQQSEIVMGEGGSGHPVSAIWLLMLSIIVILAVLAAATTLWSSRR